MLLYNVLLFDLFSIEGELIEQQSHLINRKATNLFQIEEIENLEILINILANGSEEANKIFQLHSAPLSSTKVVNPLENVLQQFFLQFSTLSSILLLSNTGKTSTFRDQGSFALIFFIYLRTSPPLQTSVKWHCKDFPWKVFLKSWRRKLNKEVAPRDLLNGTG